jgi:hypothetical protein
MPGAFWPMHDVHFSRQDQPRDRDLARYAEQLGLPRGHRSVTRRSRMATRLRPTFTPVWKWRPRNADDLPQRSPLRRRVELSSLQAAVSSLPA